MRPPRGPGHSTVCAPEPRTLALELGVIPGNYVVTLYGPDLRPESRELDVAADETARFEPTMRRVYCCPVNLNLPSGEGHTRVVFRDTVGARQFTLEVDADDPVRVHWPWLTAGVHVAEFVSESCRRYAARFDAAAGRFPTED